MHARARASFKIRSLKPEADGGELRLSRFGGKSFNLKSPLRLLLFGAPRQQPNIDD
jgi:hypothetical protein